jgi:predicted ATPase
LEVIRNKKSEKELKRFFKLLDWFQSIGATTNIDPNVLPEQNLLGNLVLRYKDKFMKTNFNELYAYDVSEGALYILFVLILLIHEDSPDIFALDNIDSTLNPGLIRQLMTHITEILSEHPEKQIFLTTHNPTTLDAIDLFNDKHRLFVVARSVTGQTELNRIEPPKDTTKEEWEEMYYGLKLSEIWLSGAIGGMPKGF